MMRSHRFAESHRQRTRQPCRNAAAAVEFAVVAPTFLIFLFGSIEFSRASMIRSTVNNAAYEAARVVVVPGANAADGIAEAKLILSVVGVQSQQVTVTPAVIDADTKEVSVHVRAQFSENAFFAPWFLGDAVIQSTCRLRTERYDML